jgi:hypothetical protein
MLVNTSKITATVGNARFDAEGPADLVLAQYTKFLKSLKPVLSESGPLTPGSCLWQRFVIGGVATTPSHPQPAAARFLHHFVTRTY